MNGRRDWAQADLRCLLCGRVLGRLIAPLPHHAAAGRPTVSVAVRFSAFRPSDPELPIVRLAGNEQFRCTSCGGGAIADEVEVFTTYDDVDEHEEGQPRRRGRPPKPFRPKADPRLVELGLAV